MCGGVAAVWPQWPDWGSAADRVILMEGSPISIEELWNSVRVTLGFLITSLTKALLPCLLSLAGRPALGRVLVVPNFFNLRMMEATVFLVTFNAADIFWYPSLDLCLDSSTELYGQFLRLRGLVFALTCTVTV